MDVLQDYGKGFQVKHILVNPGAKLSLKQHRKRAEHWVIVKGITLIKCGDKVFELREKTNQPIFLKVRLISLKITKSSSKNYRNTN